jgi:hypothetical protein
MKSEASPIEPFFLIVDIGSEVIVVVKARWMALAFLLYIRSNIFLFG